MAEIKERLELVDESISGLPPEKRNIQNVIDMLILQHHASFYRFMNGLENILDLYRDEGEDEYFRKVTDVRELATKKQPGLILNMRNGFYVTQAGISARHLAAQSNDQREFE